MSSLHSTVVSAHAPTGALWPPRWRPGPEHRAGRPAVRGQLRAAVGPSDAAAAPGRAGGSFGALLRRFRERAGWSQNALAKEVGIDASYINRIEAGRRTGPGPAVTLALARALALSPRAVDGFCVAAGHLPPSLQRLGPADPTIAAVLGVLTDDQLSPVARADFRAVVETIAARWQSQQAHRPGRHADGVIVRPAGCRTPSASPSRRGALAASR
jgi:transcriptional regulator with XRE-family HTH domain